MDSMGSRLVFWFEGEDTGSCVEEKLGLEFRDCISQKLKGEESKWLPEGNAKLVLPFVILGCNSSRDGRVMGDAIVASKEAGAGPFVLIE